MDYGLQKVVCILYPQNGDITKNVTAMATFFE